MKEQKNTIIINGGKRLFGKVKCQTSKNATLPIMSACVLASGKFKILNCPNITDCANMAKILRSLGAKVIKRNNNYIINTQTVNKFNIDEQLSKTMRSSIFLLGSLLARLKHASLFLPGGCKIGLRPIDIHISSFKSLGVKVEQKGDLIVFDATNAKPNKIKLKIPSVGATENIVEFASTLKGKTVIYNPAREPEIVDLCAFLNKMGAKIKGAGSKKITIYGVNSLHATEYMPISDRIVAGTIMGAVAVCGGDVTITNANAEHNKKFIKILSSMGCQIKSKNGIIQISSNKNLKNLRKITTGYYPKFPTDLQSIALSVCILGKGKTLVTEKVFENRFLILNYLKLMGADIDCLNLKSVLVNGVKSLTGACVTAKDLRGGAGLVVAGLASSGQTVIDNVYYIDRGYEGIENLFSSLGADIKRV